MTLSQLGVIMLKLGLPTTEESSFNTHLDETLVVRVVRWRSMSFSHLNFQAHRSLRHSFDINDKSFVYVAWGLNIKVFANEH